MKYFVFTFFLILNTILVYSQDTTKNIFDLSLEELRNLKTNSVSKVEEGILKTSQTIIVITQKELLQRGYTDIEQVFHDLPGFDISRGNGTQYSQVYQRGYRSNNTERTLLIIDGVEENDLWSNSVWLSRQYPISNIKKIEIIYGPASSTYGANAFAGVINIVTKETDDVVHKGNKNGIDAQIGYGTWNTKYSDITIAKKIKNINLILTGRYYFSDEMDLSSYKDWDYNLTDYNINFYKKILGTNNDVIAQRAQSLDRQAYYHDNVLNGITPHYSNTTKDWIINGKINVDKFTIGFQTFKRNEGFGEWYRDDFELGPENGGKWVPTNSFYYIKYTNNISNKIKLTSFSRFKQHILNGDCEEFYYKGYLNGEYNLSNLTDSTGSLLSDSLITKPYWWHGYFYAFSQQFRTEFQLNYSPNKKITWSNIWEMRKSHIQGKYFSSTKKFPEENAPAVNLEGGNYFSSTDLGLYSLFNYYPINNLKFVLGGSLVYNKIRINGGYGLIFNPKAAIIFSPENIVLKAIYSEAFQDASFWTKYGTTPGRLLDNPNLKPEKVKNFEFSFDSKLNSFLFMHISAFNAFYDGAVTTVNVSFIDELGDTVQTTQHQAVGKYQIAGIESQLRGKYKNLFFYANYSYLYPYNTMGKNKIRIGDVASHKANFGVNLFLWSHLNLNLRLNWVGLRPTGKNTTISSNPLSKIDPYYILNGATSYTFKHKFTIQILFNNILNREYFDPGVRSADGIYYSDKMPQNTFNFMTKLIVSI